MEEGREVTTLTTRDRITVWAVALTLFFALPLLDLLTGGVR